MLTSAFFSIFSEQESTAISFQMFKYSLADHNTDQKYAALLHLWLKYRTNRTEGISFPAKLHKIV